VKTVSVEIVRYSLAYLPMQKWLVGDVPLKVNFFVKVNHMLTSERMPVVLISNEIPRTSYLHRNDYSAV